jgi:hypothetical protein
MGLAQAANRTSMPTIFLSSEGQGGGLCKDQVEPMKKRETNVDWSRARTS